MRQYTWYNDILILLKFSSIYHYIQYANIAYRRFSLILQQIIRYAHVSDERLLNLNNSIASIIYIIRLLYGRADGPRYRYDIYI